MGYKNALYIVTNEFFHLLIFSTLLVICLDDVCVGKVVLSANNLIFKGMSHDKSLIRKKSCIRNNRRTNMEPCDTPGFNSGSRQALFFYHLESHTQCLKSFQRCYFVMIRI